MCYYRSRILLTESPEVYDFLLHFIIYPLKVSIIWHIEQVIKVILDRNEVQYHMGRGRGNTATVSHGGVIRHPYYKGCNMAIKMTSKFSYGIASKSCTSSAINWFNGTNIRQDINICRSSSKSQSN